MGCADLVTVIAQDAIIADAFATALSNKIKKAADIKKVIDEVQTKQFVYGIIIVIQDKIGGWGEFEWDEI